MSLLEKVYIAFEGMQYKSFHDLKIISIELIQIKGVWKSLNTKYPSYNMVYICSERSVVAMRYHTV